MIFVGDLGNKPLSEKVAKLLRLEVVYPEITIFPDGEKRVRINVEVADQNCVVLKSLSTPVDANIVEFAFLINTLKENGADVVYGVVPYLGYSRADHMFRTGEGIPLEVVIKCIESTKLDRIMLFDPHSIRIPDLFHIDVDDQSALPLFAEKIREIKSEKSRITLVSPDMGGIRRIKILSDLLGNASWATINKDRDLETGRVKVASVEGQIHEICMVADDMISTGKTMAEAVDPLIKRGAKKIYLFATHPVFSGEASQILKNAGIEKVYVTDSIFVPEEKQFAKLEILSIAPLIKKQVHQTQLR